MKRVSYRARCAGVCALLLALPLDCVSTDAGLATSAGDAGGAGGEGGGGGGGGAGRGEDGGAGGGGGGQVAIRAAAVPPAVAVMSAQPTPARVDRVRPSTQRRRVAAATSEREAPQVQTPRREPAGCRSACTSTRTRRAFSSRAAIRR